MKTLPLRFCTCCGHDVRDDGHGVMRKSGSNGQQRWQCSACNIKQKNRIAPGKKKTGRKPNPYLPEAQESDAEVREFIRTVMGI